MAKAKEVAAEVYETARDEADSQGLLPGDKPVVQKIDAVVRAVGDTVGGIAERNVPGTSSSEAGSSMGSGMTSDPGSGKSDTGSDTSTSFGIGQKSDRP